MAGVKQSQPLVLNRRRLVRGGIRAGGGARRSDASCNLADLQTSEAPLPMEEAETKADERGEMTHAAETRPCESAHILRGAPS